MKDSSSQEAEKPLQKLEIDPNSPFSSLADLGNTSTLPTSTQAVSTAIAPGNHPGAEKGGSPNRLPTNSRAIGQKGKPNQVPEATNQVNSMGTYQEMMGSSGKTTPKPANNPYFDALTRQMNEMKQNTPPPQETVRSAFRPNPNAPAVGEADTADLVEEDEEDMAANDESSSAGNENIYEEGQSN